jgi:hypothetical protein
MDIMMVALLVAILISTLAGWLISRSKQVEKPVKVMLFVLYFWGVLFVQLVIFAVLYQLGLLDGVS